MKVQVKFVDSSVSVLIVISPYLRVTTQFPEHSGAHNYLFVLMGFIENCVVSVINIHHYHDYYRHHLNNGTYHLYCNHRDYNKECA